MTTSPSISHGERFGLGIFAATIIGIFALLYWWIGMLAFFIPVGLVMLVLGIYGLGWGLGSILMLFAKEGKK